MSAIHTVGETGFLLEASGCVHLAKIYQVKWDTYDEIVVWDSVGRGILSDNPRCIPLHLGAFGLQ